MEDKEDDGLDYLQKLIRFYMVDHEDQVLCMLLMRISQGLERMKMCA